MADLHAGLLLVTVTATETKAVRRAFYEAGEELPNTILDLPVELDQEIAGIKLETMGLAIDVLSDEQVAYTTETSAST